MKKKKQAKKWKKIKASGQVGAQKVKEKVSSPYLCLISKLNSSKHDSYGVKHMNNPKCHDRTRINKYENSMINMHDRFTMPRFSKV